MSRFRNETTLSFIIKGLMPYTRPNMLLAFKPGAFFAELEKVSNKNTQTIKNEYYKAIKRGYVELTDDGSPVVTSKGQARLQKYSPTKLKDSQLLVVFDIPEVDKNKRQQFRLLLKQLKFRQVQRSVWITSYDSRDYLRQEIQRLKLADNIVIYEAHDLKL
jgi:DNA-binding transcriptional regulator PaaX